jgi:phospholipase/carboxylesterase
MQHTNAPLPYVEKTTAAEPDASVIWLHGLGADGNDFAGVIPALELPASAAVRFLFPHAPMRPVTVNNGMVMRAWYDIYSERFTDNEDEVGIEASSRQVGELIEQEIERGIDGSRIFVAGFSQGGAIALHCGLHRQRPPAGIIALSTYVPLMERLPDAGEGRPPILLLHGRDDGLVPLQLAQQSCRLLQNAGYQVDWRVYPHAHTVSIEELQDIGRWLSAVLQAA